MTVLVANLIETLKSNPGLDPREAGRAMVRVLSEGQVTPGLFRQNPTILIRPERGVSRYLAQVAWRALAGDYETLDDLLDGLLSLLDRNPPALESDSSKPAPNSVQVPEARILGVGQLVETVPGSWEATFEAHVTSGAYRGQEIKVRALSSVNRTACFAIPYFWIHSSIAAYNLVPTDPAEFEAGQQTFFVLEPLRQINATSVANGLYCPKPQVDRLRRGRGDVTVHTVRGLLVHEIMDRLIEGAEDPVACYDAVLAPYKVQLASIADEAFDEAAFRAEVLDHAVRLERLVRANPHMREDPQVELRRYSATIGIQGRIDAVFRTGQTLDIVELKTGRHIREADHLQLFTYRLLFFDYLRRERSLGNPPIEVRARILASHDGTSVPLRTKADFLDVMEARNRLVAHARALGRVQPHVKTLYADYDAETCGGCASWTRSRCREDSTTFGDPPDSPEGPDLAYFRRLSRQVRRESWATDRDLADLLDDSRLESRIRGFRTIPDARCDGIEAEAFLFRFEENRSDLTAGDRVLIHSGRISSQPSFHGYIRSIGPDRARVRVPLNNIPADTFRDRSWIIDRFTLDLSSEASQTALFDFLKAPMDARKRAILGQLEPLAAPARAASTGDIDRAAELNPNQSQAIRAALQCRTFHLIWGPPGTGKTRVIPQIAVGVEGGVLLGAFTNTALDKMLIALLESYPAAEFVRIGRSEGCRELTERLRALGRSPAECFSEDLAKSTPTARELRRRLDRIPIVAATAHRAATVPYLRGRSFEMSLIDEAGQLTEPLTLGLLMRARRFVLIGDDRQLPPVVRTRGLESSLFERLKGLALDQSPDSVTFLDVQYRMHPEIMAVSNRLYYDGRLVSGVGPEARAPLWGRPLVFVPVEFATESRSNPGEASVIETLVRSFRATIGPEQIGVISPFRAQVVLLRQLLGDTGVTIDTVERFQGGERDVIVVSFVRSEGGGFVFDDRRLNVALTRARRKLVLVAHPDLFGSTRYAWLRQFEEPSVGAGER